MGLTAKKWAKPGPGAATWCRGCLILFVLLSFAACAGPASLLERNQPASLQWPEKPFQPQVEWVKAVATPEDAGIAKGFWQKALELVTGADSRRIVKPYGVLFDDRGRLFIADPGAGLVHVFDSQGGTYSTIASTPDAPLRYPIGLATDQQDGLYITDSSSDAVYRYDLARRTLTPFLRAVDRPTGIVYSPVNRLLYITETGNNDVFAVDLQGAQRLRFSNVNGGRTPFNHPTDIAVDSKGQIYVTDPLNYKVRIFSSQGKALGSFGEMGDARAELNKPKGVAVDATGRIFLCDSMQDMVKVFTSDGRLLFTIGETGTGNGGFWMPSGIFIHGEFIFVTDTYNRRVQIFRFLKGGPEKLDEDVSSGIAPARG